MPRSGLIVASQSISKGLAIYNDVIVKRIEQLSSALMGKSVAVIHGVEGGFEKVDGYLPKMLVFENGGIFWIFLVVPDDVDFGDEVLIAFGLRV